MPNRRRNRFSWETASHVATLGSTIVAALAIIIGVYQFNIAIKKTNQQIAYIEQDRMDKMIENRPYLTIVGSKIEVYPKRRYELKPGWYFTLKIDNIGVRPANNIVISQRIIATDYSFKASDTTNIVAEHYPNPLNKGGRLDHVEEVIFKSLRHYFLKIYLDYDDQLTKTHYREFYYYTVDLDERFVDYNASDHTLFDARGVDVKIIDSLIRYYYPLKN